MNAGPSKEQLESLFKTSRKYFDELAKDYYAKDREFYNKNFAPFYSNPLLAAKRKGKPLRLVITVSLLMLVLGLAGIFLIFFLEDNSDKKPVRENVKTEKDKPASSVKDSVEKENIKLEKLEEEMKKKEKEVNQKESEVKENTGKREVRSKPVERTR
jgi:uncharacterized protein HemX